MQSILTKYLPATNTKPSRIKAWASGGAKSITRSYDHDGTTDDAHLKVARELAELLNWSGRFVEGSLDNWRGKGGNVYVIDCGRGFTVPKILSHADDRS